jgi:hypothetical protein
MRNNVKKTSLLIVFLLILVIVFIIKRKTTTKDPIPIETEISAISPVLNAVLVDIIEGKESFELWPGYMVLFSDEDSTVFIIGSLFYFEEGCQGFEVINDIIFSFYGHESSSTFQQNLVSLEKLSIKEIKCCSYESDKHAGVPAFNEEYWKYQSLNGGLSFVDQGMVENLHFPDTRNIPEVILRIKERLFVPPPPAESR